MLPDLRAALAAGQGDAIATPLGSTVSSQGKLAFVDNAVDPGTGTVMARVTMPNTDEALWPGQLVNLRINLRLDPDVVSIPREATQSSTAGTFVYLVTNGVAHVHPVTEGRQQEGRDVVTDGLKGGETIVLTGGLLLTDGAKVAIRNAPTAQDGQAAQAGQTSNRGAI
jgi:RND family efflux transporter MFP subunit